MNATTPQPVAVKRRRRLLAALLAGPAIATAMWVIALELRRASEPESPLFVTPFTFSLAEAIARDDVQRGYAFLRSGQDPNWPIAVRHHVLTNNRDVLVAPLVWAVMSDSPQSVLMLLGHGAATDGPSGHTAACLAGSLGRQNIAEILNRYGTVPTEPCS
jgi:hypothetical protein